MPNFVNDVERDGYGVDKEGWIHEIDEEDFIAASESIEELVVILEEYYGATDKMTDYIDALGKYGSGNTQWDSLIRNEKVGGTTQKEFMKAFRYIENELPEDLDKMLMIVNDPTIPDVHNPGSFKDTARKIIERAQERIVKFVEHVKNNGVRGSDKFFSGIKHGMVWMLVFVEMTNKEMNKFLR